VLAALPLVPAFAILFCIPLALRALGPGDSTGRLLIASYPIAAAAGLLAIALPSGIVSAAVAMVWLAFTLLSALHGLTRALGARRRIEELSIAVGFMYLAVGGVWFVLWRSGVSVMDFGEHVPLLTAIHFHYAGFASPILAGFVGRELHAANSRLWPIYVGAASLVIVGPALVALGIAGVRTIEAPGAAVLAAGTATVAFIALAVVLRRVRGVPARALLAVSSAAAIVAMTLAMLYAAGNPLGISAIVLEDMVRWHGSFNALGYVFCGLLAWNVRGFVN
jgi:YndJ-like protein